MAWVTKNSDESYEPRPQPRAYTRQEKAANWWHYHWIALAVAVAVILVAAWVVHDALSQTEPDLRVGCVGAHALPAETAEALQQALLPYAADRNGDGEVVVQVNSYTVTFTGQSSAETAVADPYAQMAGITQLSAELGPDGSTWLFLLEDPAGFQAQTMSLQYPDGTVPPDGEAGDWQQMVCRWSDCPILTALDLGDAGQAQLQALYLGCRGSFEEEADPRYTEADALWHTLTNGAATAAQAG